MGGSSGFPGRRRRKARDNDTGVLRKEVIATGRKRRKRGAQFYAVAGKVYELANQEGLAQEIPTEWFLQDIRD